MRALPLRLGAFLLLGFVALAPSTGRSEEADELGELRRTVASQGEMIRELSRELSRVRDEQRANLDQMSSLENRTRAITVAEVDRRIEAFETSDDSRFQLSGYAAAAFVDAEGEPNGFEFNFNPVFHYRLTDRLHFHGELELALDRGASGETETEFGLESATIDFLATDWLTVSAGQFLAPFNAFGSRLHPSWINKLASNPPIYGGHGSAGIIPVLREVGVMASGGVEVGSREAKLNYAVYVGNGASVEEHDGGEGDLPATLLFSNAPDDNNDKAVGGRIGFLPIPSVELGASFNTGKTKGPSGRYQLYGLDAWTWWQGLELRGEFIRLSRDLEDDEDAWGYYLQGAYRLRHRFTGTSGWEAFMGRLEPVLRWSEILDSDPLERTQLAVGLNYWLFPSAPLKLSYEFNSGEVDEDRLFLQLSYGF